ncbi:MAG TPA: hypothetical protein VGO35_02150 [Gammaproteobacteria bacterium]|nr:hypothetical protein [Gammaproteobacteria bacterium]
MDSLVTVSKQLEILYERGAALSLEFGTEQAALQKQEAEQEREKEEQGESDGKEEAPEVQGSKPVEFELRYQFWYSISLPLMKRLAPDRYAEFQAHYLPDPKRDVIHGYNYVIQDWIRLQPPEEETSVAPWAATLRCFMNQLCILKSVKDRLEWQALVTEDQSERCLQLEELETARELINVSERAAGALTGTVLEAYLRKLAAKHQLGLRKQRPPLCELADALKEAKVLDIPAWSQTTWLAEIYARCLKAEGEVPTKLQVRDLIDGTRWLITNVF